MDGRARHLRCVEWVVDDSSNGHYGFVLDVGSPKDDWRALGGPDGDRESWWTPERAALVGWLDRHAPALVALYLGALRLADCDSFPGRVHFVTHAIREIGNRLPSTLGPKVEKRGAGYENLTDTIRDRWLAEGLPEDGRLRLSEESAPSASGPRRHEVSVELLASVGKLIAKDNEARANKEARERAKFDALSGLGSNPSYVISNWGRWAREAVQFVHARNAPLPAEADAEWVEKFYAFEQELMAISRPSYENLDELDRLLDGANRR